MMTNRENILNELKEISPLVAGVPYINVFTVDPAYFAGIESELKARITANSFNAGDESAFTVPQGYFDNLAGNIISRIRSEENLSAADEMKKLSMLIAGIGNKNMYTVPVGYFENLKPDIEIKTPAKVIQMGKTRSVFRYAAAAVITGLLGLSVINIGDKKTTAAESANSVQIAAVLKAGDEIAKTNSFDKELNSLSDADLEQYLSGNGRDVNAAVIAASVSDKSEALPEATDYILNENTLDEYLNENNLKN